MRLDITADLLREVLADDDLSAAEVRAVARTAYVAAEIDFDEAMQEREALDQLGATLWSLAGLPPEQIPPVSPLPIDDEERRTVIRELAAQLTTRAARELAYVTAYLLVVSDLELAPIEGQFLDELQRALSISDERAADLAARGAERATPDMDATSPDEHAQHAR